MTDKEVKVNQKFAKVISKIKETEDKLFALKDKLGKLYGEKGFTPELAKYLKDQKGIIIGKEKMTTTDKPNKTLKRKKVDFAHNSLKDCFDDTKFVNEVLFEYFYKQVKHLNRQQFQEHLTSLGLEQ